MQVGPMQLLIILLLVLILFGAGRLPQVFEQLGKGIKAFRDGQKDEPLDAEAQRRRLAEQERAPSVTEAEEIKERSTHSR